MRHFSHTSFLLLLPSLVVAPAYPDCDYDRDCPICEFCAPCRTSSCTTGRRCRQKTCPACMGCCPVVGECVPLSCPPCQYCENEGEKDVCKPDTTSCECVGCPDGQYCENGTCRQRSQCPDTPCPGECQICRNGRCVDDDISCPCVQCGECQVCVDGRCQADTTCPVCRQCEVYETCFNGECMSLTEAAGCPECGYCELCDLETAQCIPDLTCPCVECLPNFDCVDGRCQSLNSLSCPPCPDCHVCDPFTGKCVPSCPCHPCPDSEYCFIPESGLSGATTFRVRVPSEDCGYCVNKIPQICATGCPNYWETCDPRSGLCVPRCEIKNDECEQGETCSNGLCMQERDCDTNCLEADCYQCHLQTGRCEPSYTCDPPCQRCEHGQFCDDSGYCKSISVDAQSCPVSCGGGGCQRCDLTTFGKCVPCEYIGDRCEETSGVCMPADIHCDAYEKTTIDTMIFYTQSAKSFLSRGLCGDRSGGDVYMKRYIAQRIKETNYALDSSCVRAEFRVVHTGELPGNVFETIPCGDAVMCSSEIELARGESIASDYSLANVFLRPNAFNISEDQVDDYGADVVVFLYLRSSDWMGGMALNYTERYFLNTKGRVMVPLRMISPCRNSDETAPGNSDEWLEFVNQIGHLMVRTTFRL